MIIIFVNKKQLYLLHIGKPFAEPLRPVAVVVESYLHEIKNNIPVR